MIKFIYVFIKFFELLVFILVGKKISKTKSDREYWRIALLAIVAFALVDGLRYGRMIDYWGYWGLYNSANTLFGNTDPLFSAFLYIFKETELGLSSVLIVQSAILIYACLLILKPYKIYAKYALPLLLPLLVMNENLSRWFMACSFLFMAFNQYNNKKYYATFLYFVAAQATHNAIFPLFPLILSYPLYNKIIIPRSIVLTLFVFMTFFSDIRSATFVVRISDWLLSAGLVNEDASMVNHLLHAQDLIQGEHLELGIMQRALYQKISNLLIWLPIIWYGYTYAKDEYINGIYNITAISLILSPLLSQVELLGRYTMFMNIFSVIVAACYYFNEFKRQRDFRFSISFISLLLFMYPTLSLIFNRGADKDMLFIWDSMFF